MKIHQGVGALTCLKGLAVTAVLVWGATAAAPAATADPYGFSPELSLRGDCQTSALDPIADPSCVGEPPAYPPPPNGSSERLKEPRAIAIDGYGNEYVSTTGGGVGRLVVFDDEGFFVMERAISAAQSIAVDSDGNLYAFQTDGKLVRYEPTGEYDPEEGKIAYADPAIPVATLSLVGGIAIDSSNGHLFVVRPQAIIEYGSAEAGNPVIETYEPEKLGNWTNTIAVDAQRRRLYVSYCANDVSDCGVLVLDADNPESELKEISEGPNGDFSAFYGWLGIAVDEELGYFFVQDFSAVPPAVYQFSEDYEHLSTLTNSEFEGTNSLQIAVSNGTRSLLAGPCAYPDDVSAGDACNRHFLFVPALPGGQLGNRALAYAPPGELPPEILEVTTAGIGETEAELRATVDPNGGETEYIFEITTQEAFEAEGFEGAAVVGEGAIGAESLATEVSTFAGGLTPGEAYRFRVVAKNEAGVANGEGQNEATFATYDDAPISSECPNRELRKGPSSQLPDCRAYELVTPPDTNGRPPKGSGYEGERFTTVHVSPQGNAVSFRIEGGSLPGSNGVGAFFGDPYVAMRSSSGWTSALAGPSGNEATVTIPGSVSPDQGYSFWRARIEGSAVIDGKDTMYLRYPDGHSELVGRGSIDVDPQAKGRLITENGTHVVFQTEGIASTVSVQLEPNAPPSGTDAVYDRTIDPVTGVEKTHVVSLLPGDVTPEAGQSATYVGASKDGEGIAFEIGGILYLRVGNQTTYEIGAGVAFAGVSEGGARVFYVEGGNLKALDTTGEAPGGEVIDFSSTGDVTTVNVAADGSRAYFVSPSVLGGTNPEGDVAQVGKQNLYLSEEGQISFVATVTDRDVKGEPLPLGGEDERHNGLGLWTEALTLQPAEDPSRLNPDGSVMLFESRAEITGYPASEFAQIYRYDSSAGRLHCISCIPTGTPADGGASLESYTFSSDAPQPFSPVSFVPNLRSDGKRAFFESEEALVSYDTDEVRDVYEWEDQGVGGCIRPGGCVYLISSGHSKRDNFLYAHSASGDDVFFTTGDILTGFDGGGTTSIYDAKVGGGFAEDSKVDCIDEGCHLPLAPPPSTSPPANSTPGNDNVGPRSKPKSCPKGKRKVKRGGKVRCVKKKKSGKSGQDGKRAGATRGVAR